MYRLSIKASVAAICLLAAILAGCVPQETCKVSFFGIVWDESLGTGLAGVRITAEGGISTQSGQNGAFETQAISMKPGRLILRFSKDGYCSLAKEIYVTRSSRMSVDASMFPDSAGRSLVEFKFTVANDYEPMTSLSKPFSVKSFPVQHEVVIEATSVVVYPSSGARFPVIAETAAKMGSFIRESVPDMGYLLLSVPDGRLPSSFAEDLKSFSWVEDAEPDYVCHPLGGYLPDDPLWPLQWAPRAVSMHRLWSYAMPAYPVVVAVVDTGVDITHPDLASRCLPPLNSINSDMRDNSGHGTHVAGIIAAELDNSIGVAGLAPNALILPVKTMETVGGTATGTMSTISRGIRLAADNGADIINMSLGWPLFFSDCSFRLLKQALDYADSKGCVLVAAAGNNGSDTDLTMPGKYGKCFTVGAVNPAFFVASYSNTGPGIDIFAPGGGSGSNGVLSTVPYAKDPTGYARMSGTSMATPHIAGMIAVLMSQGMDGRKAKDAIVASSEYLEGQDAGIANCYAAAAGATGSRALFWLCDSAGNPLSFAFKGSDMSCDMSVFGDFTGNAFLCGWVGLSGEAYPLHGDFFAMEEVSVDYEAFKLPSILKLRFVDLEDEALASGLTVPQIWAR